MLPHSLNIYSPGISLGGSYALIAIGYTMVYGILRLINFAHGDLFMMSGYLMIFAMASFPWYLSVPVVLVGTVVIGVLIEKAAYKPLRSAPPHVHHDIRHRRQLSAAESGYLSVHRHSQGVSGDSGAQEDFPVRAPLSTSLVTLVTPVLTVILVILLMQLINHTKMGMAMRAVSKDTEAARLMGIKVDHIISMTFVIGSFLAGVGAILYFTDRMTVYPLLRIPARTEMLCGRRAGRHRLHSGEQ